MCDLRPVWSSELCLGLSSSKLRFVSQDGAPGVGVLQLAWLQSWCVFIGDVLCNTRQTFGDTGSVEPSSFPFVLRLVKLWQRKLCVCVYLLGK